jgi:hypothetical protein
MFYAHKQEDPMATVDLPKGVLFVKAQSLVDKLESLRTDANDGLIVDEASTDDPSQRWVFRVVSVAEERQMQTELAQADAAPDVFERLMSKAKVYDDHQCIALMEQTLLSALKIRRYPALAAMVRELGNRLGDADAVAFAGTTAAPKR